MRPESAKLVTDILQSAERIGMYTKGKVQEDYVADVALRDAVQWNFAVIGEALSKLHDVDAATAEKITEWRRIIAFRNQLIHGYGVIKNEITWDIIKRKLPILVIDAKRLLGLF